MTRRVLVTGFERFRATPGAIPGALPPNPSGAVAERVGGVLGVPWAVLPVAFEATWSALAPQLAQVDAWVGVGLAARRAVVELETVALNTRHNDTPDNAGRRFVDTRIEAEGPLARRAAWDVAGLVQALAAQGLPVRQSHHAGTFLCNEVFYRGLGALEGRAAFVHIPTTRRVSAGVAAQVVTAVVRALS